MSKLKQKVWTGLIIGSKLRVGRGGRGGGEGREGREEGREGGGGGRWGDRDMRMGSAIFVYNTSSLPTIVFVAYQ